MRRRGTLVVTVLMVAGLVLLSAAPALAEPVGPYDVTYVTVQYNYPNPGYSTWYYTVTSTDGSNAISHLVFQLGACCSVVDAGVWTDLNTLESWWGTAKIQVQLDPTTNIFGIKFDDGFNDGETRNYYFTVQGNHAMAPGGIMVAIKTGGGGSALLMQGGSLLASVSGILTRGLGGKGFTTYEALIDGPALDCHTTAVTLSSFSGRSVSGSLAPALLIPGALLGVAALATGGLFLSGRLRRQDV
jgi:hypothetical protein